MKKIIIYILLIISCTSCLDHLFEPDAKEDSTIESDYSDTIVESNGEYPKTSEQQLSFKELESFKSSELVIMRNEIYARHGYIFNAGGEMDRYFRNQPWYEAKYDNVNSRLTEIEKANISLIKKMENNNNFPDSDESVISDNIPQLEEEAGGFGTILVEDLRLRDKPSLDGKLITVLQKGSFVNVDNLTKFKTVVELNGNKVNDYWYEVVSESGKKGWVHGCCIEVTWP